MDSASIPSSPTDISDEKRIIHRRTVFLRVQMIEIPAATKTVAVSKGTGAINAAIIIAPQQHACINELIPCPVCTFWY